MDILNRVGRDVQLIVYHLLHNHKYGSVQKEFNLKYISIWSDVYQGYYDIPHNWFIAQWRRLDRSSYKRTRIFDMLTRCEFFNDRVSKRGGVSTHRIPVNY